MTFKHHGPPLKKQAEKDVFFDKKQHTLEWQSPQKIQYSVLHATNGAHIVVNKKGKKAIYADSSICFLF